MPSKLLLNEIRNIFWIFHTSYDEIIQELEELDIEIEVDDFDIALLSFLETLYVLNLDNNIDELINKYLNILTGPKAAIMIREEITKKIKEKEEKEVWDNLRAALSQGEIEEIQDLLEGTTSFIKKWQIQWTKKKNEDHRGLYI
ncbi:MAG: hypothetical protein ACUVXA_06785 [Candidatus Jordarchaeum sp.]|uniref:hypothetical protein n=1 Tax=Candidatus Jordarchaeum sp. TaxID=2823881 RepID=UPI00404AC5AC